MKGLEEPHRDDVYDMSRYEQNKTLADELDRLQGKSYRGGIGTARTSPDTRAPRVASRAPAPLVYV